jgi:hypothetical protein
MVIFAGVFVLAVPFKDRAVIPSRMKLNCCIGNELTPIPRN